MVGRRQLREYALKALYSYSKNPQDFKVLYNNMLQSLEKIYALYVYELNLLLALRDEAIEKIEIAKNKNFKTAEDENPNLKFVNNKIFQKLEDNKILQNFTEKNKQLLWKENNQYVQSILKKILSSKKYEEYMADPKQSFEQDKEFIHKIFDKYIAKNESLIEHFEEKEIAWADDFHIANSMTYKTLKFLDENRDFQSLISVFKGEDDKKFIKKLLESVIDNEASLDDEIKERLVNWEIDRIADIDKLILRMAMGEMLYMPDVPPRVAINEYIELAKTFSSPNSNVFINGILDNFVKDKALIKNK